MILKELLQELPSTPPKKILLLWKSAFHMVEMIIMKFIKIFEDKSYP